MLLMSFSKEVADILKQDFGVKNVPATKAHSKATVKPGCSTATANPVSSKTTASDLMDIGDNDNFIQEDVSMTNQAVEEQQSVRHQYQSKLEQLLKFIKDPTLPNAGEDLNVSLTIDFYKYISIFILLHIKTFCCGYLIKSCICY